jgi:hypothetical protein
MADDDKGTGTEETFTRAQVRSMIAAEVRKEREKFADYDELKARAAAGDRDKSQLDKLTEQISALTARAEKADLEVARRDVADEFGLTRREARRLTGKTADDLRADAQELVDDLGIDVAARKAGAAKPKGSTTDDGKGTDGADGDAGQGDGTDEEPAQRTPSTRTPASTPARGTRETLRSGAPRTDGGDADLEKLDPMELIKGVPRR